MNVVSLFSGIGGFDEGFRRAGFDVAAACEIDPACRRVLRRHFPEMEIYDDVQTITETTFAGRTVDVLVGGFPCQDLSVAGRRAGLAGKRSGLWFEFLRIIGSYLPRWVVIENVPGLLSSHGGADFAVLLRGLVECGYGVAWRVLDAQYFGLAQRRERVFVVASLRSGRAAEVLFEREGGGWHPAPRREAGERIAATLTAGIGAGRGVNAPGRRREDDVNLVGFGDGIDRARCLTTHEGNRQDFESTTMISVFGQTGQSHFSEQPATLRAHGGDAAGGSEFLVAYTLRAEGHDAGEDGMGRGTPLIAIDLRNGTEGHVAQTLQAGGMGEERGCNINSIPHTFAFTERTRAEGRTVETSEELAYSLTDASKGGNPHSSKIAGSFGVRRLMPVECERLQGFPDSWTAYGDDGKPISDSARYRMLGNAVAVPCAEWIARRIAKIEEGAR